MGSREAFPVEEYLRTTFPDLDKEYRDGELVERSLPDYLHSKTQGLLILLLGALRKTFPVFVCPELRLQVRPGLYRIPDVAVFYPNEPQERVPCSPPLVAIEILSLDDRMADIRNKLAEYRTWGVTHVWLVDPHSKRMYTCDAELVEVSILRIPELNIELTPADIFE
ncbi:MAG TPA: Uma2 family endonuclease [Bryobacteraceae bacterium]|nr:Uma2 family endonuclease [Bryobacteraceae bacterium]